MNEVLLPSLTADTHTQRNIRGKKKGEEATCCCIIIQRERESIRP